MKIKTYLLQGTHSKIYAPNSSGIGWKKHGYHGRFVKKPVKTDYDGIIIGFLSVVCIILSGALVWFIIQATKIQYP